MQGQGRVPGPAACWRSLRSYAVPFVILKVRHLHVSKDRSTCRGTLTNPSLNDQESSRRSAWGGSTVKILDSPNPFPTSTQGRDEIDVAVAKVMFVGALSECAAPPLPGSPAA